MKQQETKQAALPEILKTNGVIIYEEIGQGEEFDIKAIAQMGNTNPSKPLMVDLYENADQLSAELVRRYNAFPELVEAVRQAKEYRLCTHHGDDKLLAILDAALKSANQ